MSEKLEELSASDFEEKVLKADVPVVLYFGATWCHPCKAMKPILEDLHTAAAGRYKIVVADAEACRELATEHAVTVVPTCLIFKQGVLSTRLVGLVTGQRIIGALL